MWSKWFLFLCAAGFLVGCGENRESVTSGLPSGYQWLPRNSPAAAEVDNPELREKYETALAEARRLGAEIKFETKFENGSYGKLTTVRCFNDSDLKKYSIGNAIIYSKVADDIAGYTRELDGLHDRVDAVKKLKAAAVNYGAVAPKGNYEKSEAATVRDLLEKNIPSFEKELEKLENIRKEVMGNDVPEKGEEDKKKAPAAPDLLT